MCFFISTNFSSKKVKDTFPVDCQFEPLQKNEIVNGFSHPKILIIADNDFHNVQWGTWGLIPNNTQNTDIQKMTLNARIETIQEKWSFKNSFSQRCLVLADAFYEWKWLDIKGKRKEKYKISLKTEDALFSLGGIYNLWFDEVSGEELATFSIVTTQANSLMAEIHHTKKRMPLVLDRNHSMNWLHGAPLSDYAYPQYQPELVAQKDNGDLWDGADSWF